MTSKQTRCAIENSGVATISTQSIKAAQPYQALTYASGNYRTVYTDFDCLSRSQLATINHSTSTRNFGKAHSLSYAKPRN